MTDKHTPGPWQAVTNDTGAFAIESDGDLTAVICQRADWPSRKDESLANARLIAAAPDLLEALQECATRLEKAGIFGGSHPEYAAEAVRKYRDLITKAGAA
jgi:hypothetical protein